MKHLKTTMVYFFIVISVCAGCTVENQASQDSEADNSNSEIPTGSMPICTGSEPCVEDSEPQERDNVGNENETLERQLLASEKLEINGEQIPNCIPLNSSFHIERSEEEMLLPVCDDDKL